MERTQLRCWRRAELVAQALAQLFVHAERLSRVAARNEDLHQQSGEAGAPNTGHIPGARCLPYQELVDGATGLWAAPAAVARLARDAGIDPARPPSELIATCGSGVSATVALMALERIGVHCDGVYDGSFNEWRAHPARPIAYGRAT